MSLALNLVHKLHSKRKLFLTSKGTNGPICDAKKLLKCLSTNFFWNSC